MKNLDRNLSSLEIIDKLIIKRLYEEFWIVIKLNFFINL